MDVFLNFTEIQSKTQILTKLFFVELFKVLRNETKTLDPLIILKSD